ncbi:MAG TPA: ATP-binding protein [Sedimentisphaerales bacterium]|nr:ATP-binding protein [Sedimentisphaerales bacterium]
MPEHLKRKPRKSEKHNCSKTQQKPEDPCAALLQSILQSLPLAVITFDTRLKITDANPQAAALMHLTGYVDRSLAAGTNAPAGTRLDWTKELKSTVLAGNSHTFDSIAYTLNGKTKFLRVLCAPLRKPDSPAVLGGTLIIEDVTENLNNRRKLANFDKFVTVGKLASKVAHELNNPLDGILRYLNLALRVIENEKLEKPTHYLLRCREGLMRMVHILSELLEFSRTTYAPFERVRIDHILEDAAKTMEPAAQASNVQIMRSYAHDTPYIRAGDLLQVFLNLIKNALDAMPSGGTLSVSTSVTAENTVIEFRDSGAGFPPELAQAIFEPFFTTKEKGKGTGLGLAICSDIVQKYHGRISAQNAPQTGSIFTVHLPLTEQLETL